MKRTMYTCLDYLDKVGNSRVKEGDQPISKPPLLTDQEPCKDICCNLSLIADFLEKSKEEK